MKYLVDTSVLVRLANRADTLHEVAASAAIELHRQSHDLHLTAQCLVEFRSVATRPVHAANGLGMSSSDAIAQTAIFEAAFSLLPDSPELYNKWKQIVAQLSVMGKQVHDARLIASCDLHAIDRVLTFNVRHFERLAGFVNGLEIVDPNTIGFQ